MWKVLPKNPLEIRVKEHIEACKKCDWDKSMVVEHSWKMEHPIRWKEANIIDKSNMQYKLRVLRSQLKKKK